MNILVLLCIFLGFVSLVRSDVDACYFKCQKLANSVNSFKRCAAVCNDDDLDSTSLSELMWERYRIALFNHIKKGGSANAYSVGLQMMTIPTFANWENDEDELNQMANGISAYGSLYAPTGNSMKEQYKTFLFNIDAPMPDWRAAMQTKEAREKMAAAVDAKEAELALCHEDFVWEKKYSPGKTFASFQQTDCPALRRLNDKLIDASSSYYRMRNQVQGEYKDVFDQAAKIETDAGEWKETGTSLKNFLTRARNGMGKKWSISCNSATSSEETRKWVYKKKSGFIFKRTKTKTKTEVRMQKEHFNMKVTADSFDIIRVGPSSNWLDYHFITKYNSKKNLWINKSYNFAGSAGTMPMMPKAYYVAYNPKIVLDVSKEDGLYFEKHKSSSFSFGPFVNSAKGSGLTVTKKGSNRYEVVFSGNNDLAYILAVDNHVF